MKGFQVSAGFDVALQELSRFLIRSNQANVARAKAAKEESSRAKPETRKAFAQASNLPRLREMLETERTSFPL